MPGDNIVWTSRSASRSPSTASGSPSQGGKTVGAGVATEASSKRHIEGRGKGNKWAKDSDSGSRPTTIGSWTRAADKIVDTARLPKRAHCRPDPPSDEISN